MKKSQNVLSVVGLLGGPLVSSLLSLVIPNLGLVVLTILVAGPLGGFSIGQGFLVIMLVASAMALPIGGNSDGNILQAFAAAVL